MEPINKAEIDLSVYNGNIIIKNGVGTIDTLYLTEHYDRFENFSSKSLSNDKECGHYVGFTYEFNKEIIDIIFIKNESGIEVNVVNNCGGIEKTIDIPNPKELRNFVTNLKACDKSSLEKINFNNFIPNKFFFNNNEQWDVIW